MTGRPHTEYVYRDRNGAPVYKKVRTASKKFWFERPGGEPGLGDVIPILYRLPEIVAGASEGRRIYVPEGEKDVDRLAAEGLIATTSSRGAEDWDDDYTEHLIGAAEVIVLADNDAPGREHAQKVGASVYAAGVPVKILELPGLAEHGDVSDFLESHGSIEQLEALAQSQPYWSPPDPIPLGPPDPDPLPLDALPPELRSLVETVAAATQTPPDMCVALVLGVLATALQGKAVVRVTNAWREVLSLYVAVIAAPATRKSAVYSLVLRPIVDWERTRAQETALARRMKEDERAILHKQLKKILERAAKSGFDEELRIEHEDTHRQLEELRIPAEPRLNAPSATPEALPKVAAEQGGRIAVLSPEGDSLGHLDGRYAGRGQANLEFTKKAWSGESYRDDRMTRDSVSVPHPALTIGICLQPGVIKRLRNAEAFRGEGMLGRFLMVLPESYVGYRRTGPDVPTLDSDTVADFYGTIARLLNLQPRQIRTDGSYVPHVVELEPRARRRLSDFEREIEEDLRPGGRLAPIPDWAGKLVGQAVRIAALLHVAERQEWSAVSDRSMERAIRLARALSTHALRFFDDLGADRELALANRVLRYATRMEPGSTVRDLFQHVKGGDGLQEMDNLWPILERLQRGHHITLRKSTADGRGRKPSPVVVVHPIYRRDRGSMPEWLMDLQDEPDF